MAGGRPTMYDPETTPQRVLKLALLGLTDKEMASILEISEQTFNTWKDKHPEFLESLKAGKTDADANVASRLYHRALGYSHTETKVNVVDHEIVKTEVKKHYPPDTKAAERWLMNRQRDKWGNTDAPLIDARQNNIIMFPTTPDTVKGLIEDTEAETVDFEELKVEELLEKIRDDGKAEDEEDQENDES